MVDKPAFRLDPRRLDRAFGHVADQVASGRIAFASLAVGRAAGTIRAATFVAGVADPGPRRSPIASITKPITATAVLTLVEDGLLVLTEPIATYLPEFNPPATDAASSGDAVTVWHVLTHTSGLRDADDDELTSAPLTNERLLDLLASRALRFRPGSAYAYTSDSFVILATLVERLTGQRFPDYLRRRILDPLGMSATTFDPSDPGPPAVAIEGQLGPAGLDRDEVARTFVALEMPGGGLWSTVDDLIRFGRAILASGSLDGRRVLGTPFVRLMTRTHTDGVLELDSGRDPAYGLGWGRFGRGRGLPAGPDAVGHTGATGSMLVVDPDHDLVVVYLRNVWGAPMTAAEETVNAVYAALEPE